MVRAARVPIWVIADKLGQNPPLSAMHPTADIASYFLGVIGVERATWSSIARSALSFISRQRRGIVVPVRKHSNSLIIFG